MAQAKQRRRPPARPPRLSPTWRRQRNSVALSDLAVDLPEICELDINPLLADAGGAIALDARIVVREASQDAQRRLAIKPYPRALMSTIETEAGPFRVRPIRPDDAPAMIDMANRTDAEDLRLRFHGAVHALDGATAARLSQIDYDREMALLAVGPDASIAGVARLIFDPDFQRAEYALIVRSDLQGHGIGRALLAQTLSYARARGAQKVWGDVLVQNAEMLTLARALGAKLNTVANAPELTRTEFALPPPQLDPLAAIASRTLAARMLPSSGFSTISTPAASA